MSLSDENRAIVERVWATGAQIPRKSFQEALNKALDEARAEGAECAAYYKKLASRWRGIAAAMGYEPRAHLEGRPTEKWLLDRIAKYRAQVVAEATAAPAQAAE